MAETESTPEMRPTFEEIRRTDENGHEYWSSRDLCSSMGYSANWKYQRVIDKAIEVASAKGMNIAKPEDNRRSIYNVHLRPKSAGTSPHCLVSHFIIGLVKRWVASQRSARAMT